MSSPLQEEKNVQVILDNHIYDKIIKETITTMAKDTGNIRKDQIKIHLPRVSKANEYVIADLNLDIGAQKILVSGQTILNTTTSGALKIKETVEKFSSKSDNPFAGAKIKPIGDSGSFTIEVASKTKEISTPLMAFWFIVVIVIIIVICIVLATLGITFVFVMGLWAMLLAFKNNPHIHGVAQLYLATHSFSLGVFYIGYSIIRYGNII